LLTGSKMIPVDEAAEIASTCEVRWGI